MLKKVREGNAGTHGRDERSVLWRRLFGMKPIEIDGRIGVTAILLSTGASLVAILSLRSITLYVVCIATSICIGQFTRAKRRMPNSAIRLGETQKGE